MSEVYEKKKMKIRKIFSMSLLFDFIVVAITRLMLKMDRWIVLLMMHNVFGLAMIPSTFIHVIFGEEKGW